MGNGQAWRAGEGGRRGTQAAAGRKTGENLSEDWNIHYKPLKSLFTLTQKLYKTKDFQKSEIIQIPTNNRQLESLMFHPYYGIL